MRLFKDFPERLEKLDQDNGVSRIRRMIEYYPPPSEEFLGFILGLYYWCHKEYGRLKRNGKEVGKILEYMPGSKDNPKPPGKMSEEKFHEQLEAWNKQDQKK